MYLRLRLVKDRLAKRATVATAQVLSRKRAAYKERLGESKSGMGEVFRAVREQGKPPLAFARNAAGSLVVDNAELDECVSSQWQEVYKGNGDVQDTAA
eukprot:12971773-Alexandrium_andersonii.AAC.1